MYKDDKPVLIVEVKKLGFNLNRSDFRSGKIQISEYLQSIGNVKWAILTNGVEWKLYDFSNPKIGGIEVQCLELRQEDESVDIGKKAVEELCYELLDFHESSFDSGAWTDLSKEATVFSPESLAKAILSLDVIKYVAKAIRGEYEYRANLEVLMERVYSLIENGLDDSCVGWGDAKATEFHKYVKTQKRAGRKVRKRRKGDVSESKASDAEGLSVNGESENKEKVDVA